MKHQPGFIHESKIYGLLDSCGIKTPKRYCYTGGKVSESHFSLGEKVVVKGIADNLWHKSDEGALHFTTFEPQTIEKLHATMQMQLGSKYKYIETMICEMVPFKTVSGLPTECFVSINRDDSCKTIINFGIGGIHTEAWAQELRSNILMWQTDLVTPEVAYLEFEKHWIGRVWLGKLRQGKALTTSDQMKQFINGLFETAKRCQKENIKLLEVNPFVMGPDGVPMALDGVGLVEQEIVRERLGAKVSAEKLLHPKKFAIAGVSDKEGNFGKRILENLISSKLSVSDLLVIKPKTENFLGVKCVADMTALKNNPVDALVVALPAATAVESLKILCEQNGGAEVVYIVAGGLGDGADTEGYAQQVKDLLQSRREKGLWTPTLVGPNSLGIVLADENLSTLFISKKKLPISFQENGNVGFVSQSGAFFITRLSNDEQLPIKYGFCIGNQIDLKASDFIEVMATDTKVKVIAAYIEGFDHDECAKFAQNAKTIIASGKPVVLYKGGRSVEGMAAAAGHTGSMAGNYDLQKKVLSDAGVILTESYAEFAAILKMLSFYPTHRKFDSLAVISNAGYETVASADHLGAELLSKRPNLLWKMDSNTKDKLSQMIEQHGLKGLVSATNPLDITPVADDKAYLAAAEILLSSNSDALVYGYVPLSDRLETFGDYKFALDGLSNLREKYKKPICVVVDSGEIYDRYCKDVSKILPVYRSMEEAYGAIKKIRLPNL